MSADDHDEAERAERLAAMIDLLVEHSTKTAALSAFSKRFGVSREEAVDWYEDALHEGAGDSLAEAFRLVIVRVHALSKRAEAAGDWRSATSALATAARLISGEQSLTIRLKQRARGTEDEGGGPPAELLNMTQDQIAAWLATGKLPSREQLLAQARGPVVVDEPAPTPPPPELPPPERVEAGVHEIRVNRWRRVVLEDVLEPDDLGPAWPRISALDPKLRPAVLAQDIADTVLARVEIPARWSVLMRRMGPEQVKAAVGFTLSARMRNTATEGEAKRLLAQFAPLELLEQLEGEANALCLTDPRR